MKIVPIILSSAVQFISMAANAASHEWGGPSAASHLSNACFMSYPSGDCLEPVLGESAIDRTMCRLFHDFESCIGNLECFWDDDMNRCNTRSSDDLCGLAPSRDICVLYKETCYWDSADHRCAPRH